MPDKKQPAEPVRRKKHWMMRRFGKRGLMDTSKAPAWWLSHPAEVEPFLRSLPGVTVFELGRSAGGRPIIAASWGERQDLPERTANSLASAIAGGSPEAFYGKGKRERQGFVFLGDAHGCEIEGTAAALNFLNVVATGKDLRGRRRPRLAEAGRKLRIVIVPFFNIDGRARCGESRQFVGVEPADYQLMCQGRLKTGERFKWPSSKLVTPIAPDSVDFMGAYFNDNGVNLVYDAGFGDQAQPETRALQAFLRAEMPDCVMCSHTDNGSLVQPPDAFVPQHYRQRQLLIAGAAGLACRDKGLKKFAVPTRTNSYCGEAFYQTDMIYHPCGALPLLVEFPCGYQNMPDTLEEVMEISLTVIEETVVFGSLYGFRPPDPKWR